MAAPEVDPTLESSEALTGRLFVGLSAGAVVSAPAFALGEPAPAQPPPAVPEDDPTISAEHLSLDRDGGTLPAYAARPIHANAQTPSVVVIMHIWGVDETIREAVRRLAKNGFAAIAPDLYEAGAPNGDGVTDSSIFRPYSKRLERSQYDMDIRSAATWLTKAFPQTKTGIIGFCMGGRMALLASIDESTSFSAVCPFYGALSDVDPQAIRMPLCGSYGARDASIPAESVRAFAASLKVPSDIRIYDNAGHAFADERRPSYVASAAEDAWARTISFLKKYLGAVTP